MTRLEIRDLSRKRLGETTSAFWTDAELNTYINLGCKEVAWRTKCLRDNGTIAVSSCETGTASEKFAEFSISGNFSTAYAINEVYFKKDSEDFVRLIPSSREELDALYPDWQSNIGYTFTSTAGVINYNWESDCSIPRYYYWSREEDIIGIWPPPDDDQDGAPLKCYYSLEHTDLSDDTESPTLPQPLHLAVVYYVVATGLEDRGWQDRANDMWNKYMLRLQDYDVEKKNEREDDEIISKNYRNL